MPHVVLAKVQQHQKFQAVFWQKFLSITKMHHTEGYTSKKRLIFPPPNKLSIELKNFMIVFKEG